MSAPKRLHKHEAFSAKA